MKHAVLTWCTWNLLIYSLFLFCKKWLALNNRWISTFGAGWGGYWMITSWFLTFHIFLSQHCMMRSQHNNVSAMISVSKLPWQNPLDIIPIALIRFGEKVYFVCQRGFCHKNFFPLFRGNFNNVVFYMNFDVVLSIKVAISNPNM